jgi:cell division protein FtsW (lipid II flippase)
VRTYAALLTVLFTLDVRVLGFLTWNYFQLGDLLALICLLLLFATLYQQRWLGFAGVLAAGVLAREVTLLILPVAAVYLLEKRSPRKAWSNLLLASLPALMLFALVRMMIEPQGGAGLVQALSTHAAKLTSVATWPRLLINSFLPVALFPLVAPRSSLRFLAEHPHWRCT